MVSDRNWCNLFLIQSVSDISAGFLWEPGLRISKIIGLEFRKAGSGLFKDLLGRFPQGQALEGCSKAVWYTRIASRSWGAVHPSSYEVRLKCQQPCTDEQGAHRESQTLKVNVQKHEHITWEQYRDSVWVCMDVKRKVTLYLELSLVMDVKDHKNCLCKMHE